MIILLYGKDSYGSMQQLRELKKQFKEKKQGDIVILESEDFTIESFKNHIQTQGLFTEDKLIIVKHIIKDGNKDTHEAILPLLDTIPETTRIVFYENDTADKRGKLYKELVKRIQYDGKCYYDEFIEPEERNLTTWASKELKERGKDIQVEALMYLVKNIINRWQLSGEIQKLASTDENPITLETVQSLISPKLDDNIFNFTDALAQKNAPLALKLLDEQLEGGAEPIYLLAMIARQIKLLIKIKSTQNEGLYDNRAIAQAINEHPYAVQKAMPTTEHFSLPHLSHAYATVLDTDSKLKSTPIPPKTLLVKLMYDIMNEYAQK